MSGRFSAGPAGALKGFIVILSVPLIILSGGNVAHASTDTIDKVDTLWVIISTALVMFMTPGLALFHAGWQERRVCLAP